MAQEGEGGSYLCTSALRICISGGVIARWLARVIAGIVRAGAVRGCRIGVSGVLAIAGRAAITVAGRCSMG